MNEKDNKRLSRTCFIALGAFLVLSLIFAFFRDPIGQFNIWCLAMTGEITVSNEPAKALPREVVVRQEMVREANKINKVKTPPKPQKNEHQTRKRPPEQGVYLTASTADSTKGTYFVGKKDNVVLNPQNWGGPDDLSYRFRLTRQNNGFHVVVVVKDNKLVATNDRVQYQNDCVEIYFDVRPKDKRGKDDYEAGVCHALIVPYFGKPKNANTMVFNYKGKDEKMPDGCWVKSNEVKGFGYRVEAFFPFTMFPKPPEEEFNFDIGVIDYNDDSHFCQMVWSGTKENYRGPMWFGRMKKAE